MAGQPFRVRELRYISGTTFNTAHTNAATGATWGAGNATKLRCQTLDLSNLLYAQEPDETLESILHAGRAPIPTLRTGNVQFSMYLEGALAAATANPLATLLSKIMGGIANPTANRTDTFTDVGASDSGTLNDATLDGETIPGQGLLIGTKGDGLGDGEVRSILVESASTCELNMTLQAQPANGTTIVIATTVYLRNTTQEYLDFLAIGQHANDQVQTIGGMGGFSFSGLNPGEKPMVEFDIPVADWQLPASADRASLDTSTDASGNAPAMGRGMGGFFLSDVPSTTAVTRNTHAITDLSINPNISYVPLPGPNGVNNIQGWVRVPSLPTAEFTILAENSADVAPGLYDDFANEATASNATAKQVMFQFGHAQGRCAAIEFPKCYVTGSLPIVDAGELVGWRCTLTAAAMNVPHDEDTAATALLNSPMRIHFF
jgi:hypothetical protein